ncbi:2-succinyl-5-enolpyruvyl-6-hydroxy-3-cyclohexene-1-carboxylic-acid synthase [Ornithinimicrobium cerasi]|uniref:2-succinyl-5-enolpyruvyl-6-hydroxy-3- cyclohexene-1-carboxylic-acid synthase n=1 Tax=Ornithinimicrobium cerasi TaxID=2248773 RepID=UPI000EFEA1B9|nr:2-succinyl-5-enolpyruvyl-6-hydroxy-3-cyclohexene-1-carboxylic-acid synthase [Ornithinimicrobium cerasi]
MHPSTALAAVLVDELVRGGVREAVLAPGSRSAPLAYALEAADRAGRLRLHVRVDERSAGFLALGMALASRRPVPVLTTSGTAVANLHPAVLEASHAGVPLVVMSADRPAELRGTGANQTTVQPGLFGTAVRWEADLPAPGPVTDGHWRSLVCRALASATGRPSSPAGPVHLNVSFRDPLAPDLGSLAAAPSGRADGGPWTVLGRDPGGGHADGGGGVAPGERTVVLLGDLGDHDLSRRALGWAAEAGWPVLAEPFGVLPGGATVVPHGVVVAGRLAAGADNLAGLAPDRVLAVGRLTLFRELGALSRRPGVRVEHVSATPWWTDPGSVVHVVHPTRVLDVTPDRAAGADSWVAAWRAAGRDAASVVAGMTGTLTGPGVAVTVAAALAEEDVLVLGSSNGPRDLAIGLGGRPVPGCRVVSNRGLAGIDGTVSTAVGVALAGGGGRTVALMGDLTFLHDTNGLLIGPGEPRPDLTVVVVNDDGGGIFSTLEYGEPARSATPEGAARTERLFGTPHGTDLAALCAAHHVRHARVSSLEDLRDALAEPDEGLRVVEVPLDRAGHRPLRDRLR